MSILPLRILRDLQHYRAFYAFFEQLATKLIYAADTSHGMICICLTATAAIEPCPAIGARGISIYVASRKLATQLAVYHTAPYITHQKTCITNELMAWIKLAARRYRKILSRDAATRYAFIYTRSSGEIQIEVIK